MSEKKKYYRFREWVIQLSLFAAKDVWPFKFDLDSSGAKIGHVCHLGAQWINNWQVQFDIPVSYGCGAAHLYLGICILHTHSSHPWALSNLEFQNQQSFYTLKDSVRSEGLKTQGFFLPLWANSQPWLQLPSFWTRHRHQANCPSGIANSNMPSGMYCSPKQLPASYLLITYWVSHRL